MLRSYLILILLMIVIAEPSFSQEALPVNPQTGLISVNNVLTFKDKKVIELKQSAQSFISTYSDNNVIFSEKITKSKNKSQVPIFSAKEVLNTDSAITYDCQMKVFVSHGLIEPVKSTNVDLISFKIIFYFKLNKVKYDITNFNHSYFGFKDGENGGRFENEKPDNIKRLFGSGKKKWIEIKEMSIEQAKKIASTLELHFQKNINNQYNF